MDEGKCRVERSPCRQLGSPTAALIAAAGLALSASGCAPTLDVLGVYFPAWLVSSSAGLAASYGIVWLMARSPTTRELAESGLFFVSLAVGLALGVWLSCFRGF